MYSLTILAACKDAGGNEDRKVFGDIGLGGAGGLDDLTDVFWGVADASQDPEPHGFSERFEEQSDLLELLGRHVLFVVGGGLRLTHRWMSIYSCDMNATQNFEPARRAALSELPRTPQKVSPAAVATLLQSGKPCQVLDVRSLGEWEAAHLAGATHQSLDVLNPEDWRRRAENAQQGPLFVLCQAGGRATRAASILCASGVPCSVIEGGLDAWRAAGLPVVLGRSKVLPLMRQVQIVIGLVSGVGSALAIWKDPMFGFIPLAMGAGLLFAGLSGTCGLALLMAKMPWNRGTRGSGGAPANAQPAASCCSPSTDR